MGEQHDAGSAWSDVRSLGPPGSFVPLEASREARLEPPRRRVDAVAVALLLVGVLPAVAGATLLGAAGALVAVFVPAPPHAGLVVAAAWLLAGPLALTRMAGCLLARVNGCRQPTQAEAPALSPAWRQVAEAADVDPLRFQLYVQPSEQLNAAAGAGRLVAVTELAVSALSQRQLAGVLAHELGHHLAGHARATTLVSWYALPAQLVGRVVTRLVRSLIDAGSRAGRASAVAGRLLAVVVLTALIGAVALGYLLPLVVAAAAVVPMHLMPWLHRWREARADQTAVRLGYGDDLAQALLFAQQLGASGEGRIEARVRRLIRQAGGLQ